MNEPAKHHYVPECYLKIFTNSKGKFWKLNKKYTSIRECSPGMVCYINDLHKIKKVETLIINNITDVNYVEKNAFKKEENNYGRIIHDIIRFSQDPFIISKKEYFLFLQMLVTIKRRNPSVRKDVMEPELRKELKSRLGQKRLKDYIQRLSDSAGDKINVDEYFNDYATNRIDDDKVHDISLSGFFKKDDEPDLSIQVAGDLYRCKQFIGHSPIGFHFITSDNPGFTKVNGQILNFGGFGNPFRFFFPLSPTTCLFIDSSILEEKNNIEKAVYPTLVDKVFVNDINKITMSLSKLYTLSYLKETLLQFF